MRKLVLLGILLCGTSAAYAHHGASEYLKMDSYFHAFRGDKVFYIRYDYSVRDIDDARSDLWEITPGFLYTIADGLSFDVHTHFAKFGIEHITEDEKGNHEPLGPPPFMEAAAFTLHYNLPKTRAVDIALAASYELPFNRAKDLLEAGSVPGAMLIMGRDFGEHSNFTVNITAEREDGETEFGWAAGVKAPLSKDPHGIAGAIEVFNSFDGDKWSVLPGVYLPLGAEETILKLGIEFGEDTLDFRSALLYEF